MLSLLNIAHQKGDIYGMISENWILKSLQAVTCLLQTRQGSFIRAIYSCQY